MSTAADILIALQKPETWQSKLGLLPVPLRTMTSDKYVLLNGNLGNFCLDISGESVETGRSLAWSANVGHYVAIEGDYLSVQPWNRSGVLAQRFTASDVFERLPDFHRFLERSEPNRDQSIVAHALRVMGQLRSLLPSDLPPASVIQHFLALVAAALAGERPERLDHLGWNIQSPSDPWVNHLDSTSWDILLRELTSTRVLLELKPDLELLLRHASGALFQEAHYLAELPSNYTLPGFAPEPARTLAKKADQAIGVYFTPASLARTLVEQTLAALDPLPNRIRIFDPACGSAEFLKETIRQLDLRSYRGCLELLGWDALQASVLVGRFALGYESRSAHAFELHWAIEQRDALEASEWPAGLSGIIMNPPFSAFQTLSPETREMVTRLAGAGRPNLASAFLARASDCLSDGGILASIVPASVTDGRHSGHLRELIANRYRPLLVARLGSQSVFSRATVDAGLYVGRRESPPTQTPTRVVWASQNSASISDALRAVRALSAARQFNAVIDEPGYSVYLSPTLGRSSSAWTPAPYKSVQLVARFDDLPRLGTLFDVKQGVRLGHDVFLQARGVVEGLPPAERAFFRPAVVNATLRNGRLEAGYFVWYPESRELPAIASEQDLSARVPEFYERFLWPAKPKLASRARINPEFWWRTTWSRTWQRDRTPRLVTTYFGDAGSVAYDSSGNYVVVVGHAWLARKATLRDNPRICEAYVALCAARIFSDLLQAYSIQVGGGQLSLEKKYISQVPLVDLGSERVPLRLLKELAAIGRLLGEGKEIDTESLDRLATVAFSQG